MFYDALNVLELSFGCEERQPVELLGYAVVLRK